MRTAVLAVDQGTTNTKAVLVDRGGGVLGRGSAPVGTTFPGPGRVEQNAERIWQSVLEAVSAALAEAPGTSPAAVAISNQRESIAAWDRRSGRPLGPVIGWQDNRTPQSWPGLAAAGAGAGACAVVRKRTGLALDPMFSAGKARWLLDSVTGDRTAAPEDIRIGTIDAWLVWNLTGGALHVCEAGNASRTLLFDLEALDWHDELLELFGVPRGVLPEVRASDAGFGVTADLGVLPAGIPIGAVLADSHAALFGHGCTEPGRAKATYGTGSSVMTPCTSPDAAPSGISTTLAWLTGRPVYAREGNILASGAALDWMAATLGLAGAAELDALAATVPDSAGAHFVPALSGLGAPYWDREAVGTVSGVTAGTSRAHLARAALDAVAHQVADVVEAIEADGDVRICELRADGGATASGTLMQLQADLLGRPVRSGSRAEVSALGAARLAWAGAGLDTQEDPGSGREPVDGAAFEPEWDPARREAHRGAWRSAVARARGLPVPGEGARGTAE